MGRINPYNVILPSYNLRHGLTGSASFNPIILFFPVSGLVIGERWSNERSMNRMAGISTKVYHGETYLGEAEMFVPPWKDQTQNPNQNLPLGNSREIRISHLSPHSERCPPLAILQTISPFSVRFKLQAKSITTHPLLHRFYLSCFQEFKVRSPPHSFFYIFSLVYNFVVKNSSKILN